MFYEQDWILWQISIIIKFIRSLLSKESNVYEQDEEQTVFKEEIEKLINDGQIRHDLGVKGRKYIETYHDCKKNAKVIAKIYEGTANKTKGKDAFEEVKEL